jgi:hypothetical protein
MMMEKAKSSLEKAGRIPAEPGEHSPSPATV